MDIESHDRSLEAVSDDARLHRIVDAEIRKLKLDERSIITLFHLQDVTIEEISRIVGKPEGTIKSILHRVRQKLRVRLEALKPEPRLSEGVA
jgi:RNA polymerase sigma-70 factor (ECF subfamily)